MGYKRLAEIKRARKREWRVKARERLKDVPVELRKEVRQEIASEVNTAAQSRAFRRLKIKGRKERARKAERLEEAKLKAIRAWKPGIKAEDARSLAARSTLVKVSTAFHAKERPKFKRIDRGSPDKPGVWRRVVSRSREIKLADGRKRKIKVRVATGPFISGRSIRRMLSARAYWARVKALAKALEISTGEARKVDRLLLDVPDSMRRRIYERLVDQAVKKYARKRKKKR